MNSFLWFVLWLVLQLSSSGAGGWRMEGFNPSRTNVSTVSGPNSKPEFKAISANVPAALKRIADDGSLILTDGATVSSYTTDGEFRWHTNVLNILNNPVVDVALARSGIVYVSSANQIVALDPKSGLPTWPQPVMTNSGDESGPLVVGADGTIYFHTGSTQPGNQERLSAINPDGTRKWEYAGNAGRGSGRPVFNSDESTIYLPQLRPADTGGGKVAGLSAATGQVLFETLCDVRGGVYAYSRAKVLYTGDVNNNLLQFPSDTQNCSVSTSGLAVTDTAAVLSTLFVVQIPLPGTGTSYAAVNTQGRRIWSRTEPLIGGFADNGGEGSGTFFAIAPQTNEIVATRIATGDELWRQQFGAPVSSVLLGGNGSLYAVAGNNLFRTGAPSPGHSHMTSMTSAQPAPASVRPNVLLPTVLINAASTDPSVVGQWSAPAAWPVVAVHVNVMPTGKVLAFDDAQDNTTSAVVWDPVANTFTNVTPADNLFCSGETQLADGRIMVVGGHINDDIGLKDVNIFNPFTQTWSMGAPMSYARWYPSAMTLSDGRVLVLEGTQNCKDCIASTPEVYNPTTDSWQQLTSATSAFARYFPQAYALPNGKVLVSGTSQVATGTVYAINSLMLDVNSQTWTTVDPNTTADGLSAMYLPGKVVRIGGSWDDGYGFPTNTTSILDMTAATPAWRTTNPMSTQRVLHNLTVLPDGTVLTTGGSSDPSSTPAASGIMYSAELWNPNGETWTTLSSMQTPRLYHSNASLLPDGRVLVAGGGRAFTTDELNAEIFSPPYLFKGTRPTITSAPSQANYNSSIFVATPNAANIAQVSLVRTSSVTHTTNFNQRFVPLTFTQASGGLNITTPANANIAPPGYYMLFILDGNGIPSVAPFVQLTTGSTAPSAPTNLTATALSTSQINLGWTASTGNVSSYLIERCAGTGCSNFAQIGTSTSTSYSDTLLTASTSYSYRVRATDGTNFSGYSNVASATTPASGTPPTPPSNLTATVISSTQINLSWTASTGSASIANYLVERCQGAGCSSFTQIASPTATSYGDTGVTGATSYSYRVRAADTTGNLSGYSNVVSTTTPFNNGLVAAYSFDEGTGTTVADSSGNGNTGTISKATWTASSKYGNALVFNGTSSVVTIPDSPSLHLSAAMTLEAWVKPTATPNGWVDVIYKQTDNYLLEASSTVGAGPTAAGTFGNGFQNVAGPSALNVNTWTHLAVIFDGANLTVWVNGVNVASQPQTSPLAASSMPLQIGGDSIYGQYFTGAIDEVRVYNRALAKSEIEVDMNSPIGSLHDTVPPTAPTNLQAFAGGAPATIIARQSYLNNTNKAANTTATFDSTGGDLIVVFGSSHELATTMTISDNKANTWISAAGPTNHSSASVDLRSQIWYAKAAKVGTGHTVSITLSTAQALVISVFVIKGSNITAPIDVTSAITDNGGVTATSITSASVATTKPADLLLNFGKVSVGVTWTAGSGYTFESTASSNYLGAEDTLAGTSGSYNATWTMTPAVNWQNVLTSVVSANAAMSNSQITMTWSPSTDNIGVTGYLIERCAGVGCSNFWQVGSTTGFSTTSYTDTGLSTGTAYAYRIRATDAEGNLSPYSNTVNAATTGGADTIPPTAPANLTAAASGGTQTNLSWTASTDNVGVTGYLVERCQGTGCSSFTQIGTSATASYSDTGLTPATSYSYRVRATDAAGNLSTYSNTASAVTVDTVPPTAPANLTAAASGGTQVNLSWTASTDNVGVTGYLVERCQGVGCSSFAQIATPATATYSDTGLTSAVSYSYRVRATDAASNLSSYSNTASATTADIIPPSAPSNLTAVAPTSSQINLSWTASTDNIGVTGYLVERCQGTGCASFTQIASQAATTYSDTGLTSGVSYSYRVRATDAASNLSGYSNVASATTPVPDTTPPTAPSNLTAAASGGTQTNLSWTASTDNVGVTGYLVERCQGTGCSSFTQIGTSATASYSDTGLTPATSYSYRVRATDAAGNLSTYSNTASAVTADTVPPTAPSNLTAAAAGGTQINLSWTASTDNVGVTGYLVERCQGVGCSSFAQIATPATTTFSDTGLTSTVSYSYRVRATDAAGNRSGYSNTASATTADIIPPSAPSSLTAVAPTGSQINLSWTASTDNIGVTGYLVERCLGTGCASFAQIASQAGTAYNDTGLTPGGSYSYRVRATDAAGNLSGYSNVASATTPVPDTTPPTAPASLTAYAGGPAPSVIARQSYINSTSLTTHTTAAFDSTGGDLIVVFGSSHGGVTLTPTDSKGNTWITAAGPTNHSTVDLRSQVWYAKAANVGAGHTITMNLSAAQPLVISVLVIKGSNTAAPIDVISNITDDGGNAGTAITSAAITTTQPADVLIDFAKVNNGVTWTAGSGYTFEGTASSNYLAGEDALAPSTGAYTASWAMNLAVNWQNVLLGIASANASTSSSQITTTWSPSTDNVGVTGYLIESCSGTGCSNFAQIGTAGGTSYTNSALSAGTQYNYRVRATDAAGNLSAYSNTANAATTGGVDTIPPTAPANLTAAPSGGTQTNLSWSASTDNLGVTGYLVERCQGTGCSSFTQIGTSASASYSDTGLTPATSYSYRVRATDAAGNLSTYSNTASAVTVDTIPPAAPANLTAAPSGGTQINLSWTASTDNVGVTGYLVERCQGVGCSSFAQIATPATTSYSDTGLTSAVSYSYRVRATDAAGNLSGYSGTASATTADIIPPSAPSSLTAVAPASSQINLSWTASTDNVGVTGYRVERCQGTSCASFAQIAAQAATTYSDTGLTSGVSYSYRVRATDAAGNLSGYSNVASATTPVPDTTPPTAPSSLTAAASGSTLINLSWTASTDNVGVTGYFVERCLGAGCSTFAQIATPAGTSYADTGLTTGSSYSYRVRATDAAGNLSAYSNVASATTTANTGLVAAYSFNEGTGTTVADSSGNGNTGTLSNTTWTASGKYGKALVFNGTSSVVTIPDSSSLHLGTGMTLEAWVYPTATPSGWVDVIYKQTDIYMLEASSTVGLEGPTAAGTFGNGFQNVAAPSGLSLNTWTHVAVTFDGANMTVWVNGVNVASQAQTSPLTTSTQPLQIGGDSIYGQYFTGRIDEVRVYNRALAKNEIEVDMNSPVGSVGDTVAPTAPANLGAVAGGAPASIIARQTYLNNTNKAANTTATFNSTGGDLIVVFGSTHEAAATMTISDNKANTWISAAGPTNHSAAGVDLRSQIWYAKAAKVGTGHTVSITLSTAQALVISVFVIKGSNITAPIDVTSAITDNGGVTGTSITSASITTTKPADLLLNFGKVSVGVTWTAGSGYTFESTASSNYLGAEDSLAGASGSYNASWTMTPAVNWQNVLTSVVSANATASSSQITMIWNSSTDNTGVTGYFIERCTGAGCSSFTQVGSTTGFSTTSYTDTALSPGTTYTYRVRATDAAGNLSSYSNTAAATTTVGP